MPQLDTNLLLPITFWVCLSFNAGFIFFYVYYALPLVNRGKIFRLYKSKRLLQVCGLYRQLSVGYTESWRRLRRII